MADTSRSLWYRLEAILDAAESALTDCDLAVPERVYVVPGAQVAWDDCCEHGGQLWVRIVKAHLTEVFPTQVRGTRPCGYQNAVLVGVGIIRCASSMDDQGHAPPADTLTTEAHQMVSDMAALRRAISCDLDTDVGEVVVDQWVPLGPGGGCAGGEWTAYIDADLDCVPIDPESE